MAFKQKGWSGFTQKGEGYMPQTQKNKKGGRDMIPQTELDKMSIEELDDARSTILNNEYSDAKSDNDTSRIKLLEGRMNKLSKKITEKEKNIK